MGVDRLQLQMIVTKNEVLLASIFETTLARVGADHGYLAFVDPMNNLRIIVQKGEYWHLPATHGVSGAAFQTGKTQIDEPGRGPSAYRESGIKAVVSEIAVPVFRFEEPVGILLFDSLRDERKFGSDDKHYLEDQARKIEQALSDQDPWSFRSWWAKERKRKTDYILATIKRQFMSSLRDHFARYSDVEVRIAKVDENGNPDRYEALLETVSGIGVSETDDEREPVQRAVAHGRAQIVGNPIPRYRCYIPFPNFGPVVGVIRLETSDAQLLENKFLGIVEEEVRKLKIDPLAVSINSQVDDHYYLNFIHEALTSHLVVSELHDVLVFIIQHAKKLCAKDIRLYYIDEFFSKLLNHRINDKLVKTSYAELLSQYIRVDKSETQLDRVYYLENSIICPIFDLRKKLVGAISVELQNEKLEDGFNSQVIEHVAVLIGHVIENFRIRSFSSENKPLSIVQDIKIELPRETRPVLSANESSGILEWLLGIDKIDLDDYRIVGNYVVGDESSRTKLSLDVDEIKKRAGLQKKGPYPVLICAPPGSGKTFFVREFARTFAENAKNNLPLIYGDLSSSQDIATTTRAHFKKILIAEKPRIAMLDEIDTKVGSDSSYRYLLRAIEGGPIDLGDSASASLPNVIWFFAGSTAENSDSFRESLKNEERGIDFFRRFEQNGQILQFPKLGTPKDIVIQTVANTLANNHSIKKIQASVLYYFAVTKWSDSGALNAKVRIAVQDMGTSGILRKSSIADNEDFNSFMEIHGNALAKLKEKLIRC